MEDFDLTKYTTFQLEEMHKECKEKITKMIADLSTIVLCAEIEQELQKRK